MTTGTDQTVEFSWIDQYPIRYTPATAALPIFFDVQADGSQSEMPLDAEYAALCNIEARILHNTQEAWRTGVETYEIRPFDQLVISRVHWIETTQPDATVP